MGRHCDPHFIAAEWGIKYCAAGGQGYKVAELGVFDTKELLFPPRCFPKEHYFLPDWIFCHISRPALIPSSFSIRDGCRPSEGLCLLALRGQMKAASRARTARELLTPLWLVPTLNHSYKTWKPEHLYNESLWAARPGEALLTVSQATASLEQEGVLGEEAQEISSCGEDSTEKEGAQDEFPGPLSKREGGTAELF